VGLFAVLAGLALLTSPLPCIEAAPPERPRARDDRAAERLRPIRIAIFDMDVLGGISAEGPVVTDQINAMLAALPEVTLVNRDQIRRVAEEHQIALSGLVETPSAVRLGKFLSAQYIVVGRASRIEQSHYLVLKIIDVETTVQTTVSAKAPVEDGFQAVLARLEEPLSAGVRRLQRPVPDPDEKALSELRKRARPLAGKVVLVSVDETHVGRPLDDPAAQMAIMQRLRSLGLSVIVPQDPVAGWKEALLQTGRYGEKKVDYLLEGEGVSAFAAQLHGLVSCRARVELRLVPLPGRTLAVSDRGVAAGVDLAETFAAKTALEEAGIQACDAVITRYVQMERESR
jgi:hypothetical protein